MKFNRAWFLFQSLIARLGRGNLMTIAVGLLIVLTGRFFILSLAARIPQQQPEMIVHQVMAQNEIKENIQKFEVSSQDYQPLKPFELLSSENSINIASTDITSTEEYWNHDWWIRYLLQEMSRGSEPFVLSEKKIFMLYRDDGSKPLSGTRLEQLGQDWLLCESQVTGSLFDRNWTLKSAWQPKLGLSYFRLDAPQYLHGELKADEAILEQAKKAAGNFKRELIKWVQAVTNEDAIAPVAIPQNWYSAPDDYRMEGMICHVIYDNEDDGSRFIIFYNVAIMQVTGFSLQ